MILYRLYPPNESMYWIHVAFLEVNSTHVSPPPPPPSSSSLLLCDLNQRLYAQHHVCRC